jgi:hypothetical protein
VKPNPLPIQVGAVILMSPGGVDPALVLNSRSVDVARYEPADQALAALVVAAQR